MILDTGSSPCETPSVSLARVAIVAGALIALFACGSSSTSSESSPSPSPTPTPKAKVFDKVDACSLVTATDASTATGATMVSMGGASGACFYGTSDGKSTVLVFAQAYADVNSASAVNPEQSVAALNSAYGIANAKVVTGIGDKAVEYNLTGAAAGYVIFVVKSNVIMMIAVSPAATGSVAEQLARTAVGNLK